MACRLFSAKPLSKPMLGYCQMDPEELTSVIFFYQNVKVFIHEKALGKHRLRNGGNLVQWGVELRWVLGGSRIILLHPKPVPNTNIVVSCVLLPHVTSVIRLYDACSSLN